MFPDSRKRYDVAFSFLKDDGKIASALASELATDLSTFVYSRNQEDVAGKNGVEPFARVFQEQSTLNVVLYRKGWGDTPWTELEMNAIQSHALRKGWSTVLLVQLVTSDPAPVWYPSDTRIYFNFPMFGVSQLAGAIRARALELGALPIVETVVEKARRLAQERDARGKRETLVNSADGLRGAYTQLGDLFTAIEHLGKGLHGADPSLNVRFGASKAYGVLQLLGYSLCVELEVPCANSARDAALRMTLWRGRVPLPSESACFSRAVEIGTKSIQIAYGESGWLWNYANRRYDSAGLADALLHTLLTLAIDPPSQRSVRKVRQSSWVNDWRYR